MTGNDAPGPTPPGEDPAVPGRPGPGTSQPDEDPGYLTRTGEAVGDDGSVAAIIGGLPAVEGSAWDIGAPLDERGADPAEEPGSPPDQAGMNPATDRNARIRARLEQHWEASESGDVDTEHAIYATDAILDYPQSGERFRGRSQIQAQRGGHPAERHFTILQIRGGSDLWVSECVITYDGVPTCAVSVMEFTGDFVAHETQYFADPFQAPAWRAAFAEPIPDRGR